MAKSRNVWLHTFDWLFICLAVGLLAHLSRKGVLGTRNILSAGHNRLGFVICIGGILYFFITWFRLAGSWFSADIAGHVVLGIIGVFLFPIWLVWLGRLLGRATTQELAQALYVGGSSSSTGYGSSGGQQLTNL